MHDEKRILHLPCDLRLSSFAIKASFGGEEMSEDAFNMSLRKFLKTVGVTSQREIEEAVRASGTPSGKVRAKVVLTIDALGLTHEVAGDIEMPGEG